MITITAAVPPHPGDDVPTAQTALFGSSSPVDETATSSDHDQRAALLVTRVARALGEVWQGRRPPTQLLSWMPEPIALAAVREGGWAGTAELVKVRAQALDDLTIEGCLLFAHDGRTLAITLRLERGATTWLAVHLGVLRSPALTRRHRNAA